MNISNRRTDQSNDMSRVKLDMIRLHRQPEDAWIVLHGNVYDVTEYLAFHPGGRENMMRGVAMDDATQLFNEVHPWVNYDKVLLNNYVGPVIHMLNDSSESGAVRFDESNMSMTAAEQGSLKDDFIDVPQHVFQNVERFVTFNWVQEHDILLMIFETGKYGNPFFEIRKPINNHWTFVITFPEVVFVYNCVPMDNVVDPPRFKIHYDSGSVDIGFEKAKKVLWTSCGEMKRHTRKFIQPDYRKKYVVREQVMLNKFTFMVSLEKKDKCISNAPLGSYITFHNELNEQREYTPVPYFYMSGAKKDLQETYNNPLFTFIIRRYTDGRLSNFLYSKKVGDIVLGSEPEGSFDLQLISGKDKFMFMAGGVGITPFLGIIQFLMEKKDTPVKRMFLVIFNPTPQHEFLLDKLKILADDKRFSFTSVLTDPPPDYIGLCGHISSKLMHSLLRRQFTSKEIPNVYFFTCGPATFMNACNEQFGLLKVDPINTFFFQSMMDHNRESSTKVHTKTLKDMDGSLSAETTTSSAKSRRTGQNKDTKERDEHMNEVMSGRSTRKSKCVIF